METEKVLLVWQIIAVMLLMISIIIGYGNISLMSKNSDLMRHINLIIRNSNKSLKETLELRKTIEELKDEIAKKS